MIQRILVFSIVATVAAGTAIAQERLPGSSSTTVTRDRHFLYLRTPWKEMQHAERRQVVEASVKLLQTELEELFPDGSRGDRLGDRLKDSELVDGLVDDLREYVKLKPRSSFRAIDAFPSGFMLLAGGKFSANLKVGGGGSMTFGVVVVPTIVQRISLERQSKHPYFPMDRYLELDWALFGAPALDVGVGAGGGTAWRVGAGLIWGQLRDAKDFSGALLSLSKSFTAGVGMNAKSGILRSGRADKFFPFVMLAAEFGASVTAELHLNASYILPMDKVFDLFFEEYRDQDYGGYQDDRYEDYSDWRRRRSDPIDEDYPVDPLPRRDRPFSGRYWLTPVTNSPYPQDGELFVRRLESTKNPNRR